MPLITRFATTWRPEATTSWTPLSDIEIRVPGPRDEARRPRRVADPAAPKMGHSARSSRPREDSRMRQVAVVLAAAGAMCLSATAHADVVRCDTPKGIIY